MATTANSLAGRLRNRLRRSMHRGGSGGWAAGMAAAGAAGGAGEDTDALEQEEFVEPSLHPDLDDCAELSELLLPAEDDGAAPEDGGGRSGWTLPEIDPTAQATKELQAQLMALAIENEALRARAERAESELVSGLRRQLAAEQAARLRAEVAAATAVDVRPPGRLSRAVNRLRRRRPANAAEAPPAAAASTAGSAPAAAPLPDGADIESLSSRDSGSDSDADGDAGGSGGRAASLVDRVRAWAAGRLLDLMEDLQPDTLGEAAAGASAAAAAEGADAADGGPPLSARRLKANASRFGRNVRPLLRCLRGFRDVTRWRSPSYTVLVALTYYFALRYDLILQLTLLLCIARLGINYLKYRRRWNIEFNFLADYETPESGAAAERERTVGTQVNFVVQVARKVQNLTGTLSDNMEKFKNLVTWQSPKHTQTLLNSLIAAFAVTLVLPATTCLYYAGIYLGVKLLLMDALFARYPKLRRRYDGFSKLWRQLPTDQQRAFFEAGSDREKYILPNSDGTAQGSPLASDDEQFCQAFALPNMERPLPPWRGGKRCAIICKDSDRSLPLPSALKHGRLFLTRSFLCYERSKDRGKTRRRNLVIPLAMIRSVKKTKALAWFPGGGMSVEVQIFGVEKPITFGAIIGRDEAFDSLAEAGRKAGLAWAGVGGQPQQPQASDPQLAQAVTQALMSDSDLDD